MSWINETKCQKHMRLDIGSGDPAMGEVQPEGFVLNDIELHPNIDLVCDIRDLNKYIPNEFCSEIRACHVLEHFGTKETQKVIKMVHDLLEPHGKFTIFVPNFLWHAQLVLSGSDDTAILYCFGGQKDKYDYHKTGYTPKLLEKYLKENGFTIESMNISSSIECVAIKN